ncbi:MAG: DUF4412 domain-containing protein [Sphingobacteriales bacterium]
MKKQLLLTIGAAFILLFAAAQNGAHVEYKLSSDKGINGSMNLFFMDGNYRSEMKVAIPQMPAGGMNMVTITQKDKPNTHYLLNESGKTYREVVSGTEDKTKNENQDCEVTVLGKEKVGTYNCTHVSVKQGKTTYEMWTTTEVADYKNYQAKDGKYMGNEKVHKALIEKNADGFAAKIVFLEEGGREGKMTMELIAFEKKTLTADLFQIPAGFTKADPAPSMMPAGMPDIKNMTPEERDKFIEQMKKQYGK